MKWLLLATIGTTIVLLWRFQPQEQNFEVSPIQTSSELLGAALKVDIDGGSQAKRQLSSSESWLNSDTRFLFDFFAAMYVENEQVMWEQFNQFCAPLQYCLSMTDLYKRYLHYKVSLGGIDDTPLINPQAFSKRLDDIETLRSHIFSQLEKRTLFAEEEIWDRHAIERMQINQDPSLRIKDKMVLLEQHIASLPSAMKASIQPTLNLRKISQLREQSEVWGEANYNSLSAEFGPQAAQRLVNVENAQQQWLSKIQIYMQEKDQLIVKWASNAEGYQQALQSLEAEMFTSIESRRLKVYLSNPSLFGYFKNE